MLVIFGGDSPLTKKILNFFIWVKNYRVFSKGRYFQKIGHFIQKCKKIVKCFLHFGKNELYFGNIPFNKNSVYFFPNEEI